MRQVREGARVHVRQRVGAQLEAREAAARLQHARRHHLHAVAGQRAATPRAVTPTHSHSHTYTHTRILTGPPAAAADAPRPAPPSAGSPPGACTHTYAHTFTYSTIC